MDFEKGISERDRKNIFQAYSGLILVLIIMIFTSSLLDLLDSVGGKIVMNATGFLLAFFTLIVALRFLFTKNSDITNTEVKLAKWAICAFIFLFGGLTLILLGDEHMLGSDKIPEGLLIRL